MSMSWQMTLVVLTCVVGACVLGALHVLPSEAVSVVLGGALGNMAPGLFSPKAKVQE